MVESETFADAHYCYVQQELVIVSLQVAALTLRQEEVLFLLVGTILAFLLKMNADPPLFEPEEPSYQQEENFHPYLRLLHSYKFKKKTISGILRY